MLPVQPAAAETLWRPLWSVWVAALTLVVAGCGVIAALPALPLLAQLGTGGILLVFALQVPCVAGGVLMIGFLRGSRSAAFGWGIALVALSIPISWNWLGAWR